MVKGGSDTHTGSKAAGGTAGKVTRNLNGSPNEYVTTEWSAYHYDCNCQQLANRKNWGMMAFEMHFFPQCA